MQFTAKLESGPFEKPLAECNRTADPLVPWRRSAAISEEMARAL